MSILSEAFKECNESANGVKSVYVYDGPIYRFQDVVIDKVHLETTAVSLKQAINNILFKAALKIGYDRRLGANVSICINLVHLENGDPSPLEKIDYLNDNHKCPRCGCNLNDQGECPVCDLGEDPSDNIDESLKTKLLEKRKKHRKLRRRAWDKQLPPMSSGSTLGDPGKGIKDFNHMNGADGLVSSSVGTGDVSVGGGASLGESTDKQQADKKEISENTIKRNNKWVNKGKKGTHGTFKTKKAADSQRKAMFANGFKESLNSIHNNDMVEINNNYYLIDSPDHEISQDKTIHLISLNGAKYTISLEKFNKEARLVNPKEAEHIAKFHNNRKINKFKENLATELTTITKAKNWLKQHPEVKAEWNKFKYNNGDIVDTVDLRKADKVIARIEFDPKTGNVINNHNEVKEYDESLSSNTNLDKKNSKTEEKIEKHTALNPILWDDNEELKPEIKDKILKIIDKFKDNLEEDGINLDIKDIVIVGSNASYNYTDKSDIDVHIIANIPEDMDYLPIIYDAYKSRFNDNHDINMKGHEVEIYVEPKEINVKSNGIYSLNTGWIKKPDINSIPDIDEEAFDKLFTEWEDKYFDLIGEDDNIESGEKIKEE